MNYNDFITYCQDKVKDFYFEKQSIVKGILDDLAGYKVDNGTHSVTEWVELIQNFDSLSEVIDSSVPVYYSDRIDALNKNIRGITDKWDELQEAFILDGLSFFNSLGTVIFYLNQDVFSEFLKELEDIEEEEEDVN